MKLTFGRNSHYYFHPNGMVYNLFRFSNCCLPSVPMPFFSVLLTLRRMCCWLEQQGQRHASFLRVSYLTVPDWHMGQKHERTLNQRRLQTKSLQRHYKDPYRTTVSCMHKENICNPVDCLMGFTWMRRVHGLNERDIVNCCCIGVLLFLWLILFINFSQIGFTL